MLLSLERVVEGDGIDNLTKVIDSVIKRLGGVEHTQLAIRLASFGVGKITQRKLLYVFSSILF